MADIMMTMARIGMGNPVHPHVHRHNKLNLESQNIDQMLMATAQGGIVESMLNNIAGQSGGLTVNPRGQVNIEETYNQRCGLAMLKFSVMMDALKEEELTVLFYCAGGGLMEDGGIDPATMLVPIRSYTVAKESITNLYDGMPMVKQAVSASDQFLLGDPTQQRQLRAVRPEDMANEVLGYMSTEQENRQDHYHGNVGASLGKHTLVSKTQNLDSTFHAKQLLKIAGNVLHDQDFNMSLQDSVAGSLYSSSMKETIISQNPFFKAMAIGAGHYSWNGFQGYTLGEICDVFPALPDVLDLSMLDEARFPMRDEIANSSAYGASNMVETTAQEIAMLTTDLLIRTGLTHIVFAASNNVHEFGGLSDNGGVEMVVGEWMSITDQDQNSINRLERFKQLFKDKFYTKYNNAYAHLCTVVNIVVNCSLFGETSVEVYFNGETEAKERYVNATYYLARTSTNIASNENGVTESVNFLNNLREYFIEQK
ncbi:hypothetical protein D3C79_47780 [compost metagenome]